MKCLITSDNDGVIMDKISFVTWGYTRDLPKELKGDISEKAVVIATDVNNNKIIVGIFSSEGYAMEIIDDIMAWLADPNVNDIYCVYPEHEGKALGNAPEFDYPYYYESYLKKGKVERKKKKTDKRKKHDIKDEMSLELRDMDLTVRTNNTLLRHGIKTLQDIVNLSPDELKQTKSLSQKGYKEIVQLLKKHGINTDKYKI